jgi:hypothetical protein
VKILITLLFFLIPLFLNAQPRKTENLIIITLDGFRWQELFFGADSVILFNTEYSTDESVRAKFWNASPIERRQALLPFIWGTFGNQGQLYGNRDFNNRVDCANKHWFSYPGYSEMLTGMVDRRIRSNDRITNPNKTVLEFINDQTDYMGKVAAFSTWDVIPYVIRAADAGIPVNCGEITARIDAVNAGEIFMEAAQQFFTKPYADRKDAFTFYFSFEYLKEEKPNVLFISFDETDDHAHHGRYDQYLRAAYNTDRMIAELWEWLQQQEQYKDKTTILLTTDHGRGSASAKAWKKHGRLAFGSGQTWFAVLGPDTPGFGEIKTAIKYLQKQFAKTAAAFLGFDYYNVSPVGNKINTMFPSHDLTLR